MTQEENQELYRQYWEKKILTLSLVHVTAMKTNEHRNSCAMYLEQVEESHVLFKQKCCVHLH